ncbi:MAG: dienelactone hydrolase family protein [Acetobacteraceae bacterium]|nr:dienelactone hydrolase family protein [Acetobacteraceae bacterium]
MGNTINLTAADGHTFSAYKSGPADARAGIVVIQEIFGVNHHIRNMADRLAAEGFLTIAPALFDRAKRDAELGYTGDDIAAGRALRGQVPDIGAMLDVEAAAAALGGIPAGIVGYCYGGTIAWWGATRTKSFKAASGWYGGGVAATAIEVPNCAVQLHFGEKDTGIPMADVEKIRAAQPGVAIYVYEGAQHGFGCDERASFSAPDAALAQARTVEFFRKHLVG